MKREGMMKEDKIYTSSAVEEGKGREEEEEERKEELGRK